jgi:hypothetical protein
VPKNIYRSAAIGPSCLQLGGSGGDLQRHRMAFPAFAGLSSSGLAP